jgi:ABC-type antimicrobial peptide transport system permease subunit
VFTVAVRERTREMGVRRALGAQRGGIVRLVLAAILKVAGIGALLGVVAALWAGRLVESLLYGVEANDAMTLGAVVVGCVVLALVAGLVPALRASAIDPAVSLRSE